MDSKRSNYLECERWWVFALLMVVGGYFGAFTYTLRGGVFCNAQTANFVLMAMELGNGQFLGAVYYLIPMSAYFAGAILSELLPSHVKKSGWIRWDTLLVAIELVIVIGLGFLPESAPFQISQIAINFICSMQYNTFRQAEGIPMATTFCTNHLRQIGICVTKWGKKRERLYLKRMVRHLGMLGFFVLGATISTIFCNIWKGHAIWGAGILLIIVFADLIRADITHGKEELSRVPLGH